MKCCLFSLLIAIAFLILQVGQSGRLRVRILTKTTDTPGYRMSGPLIEKESVLPDSSGLSCSLSDYTFGISYVKEGGNSVIFQSMMLSS